MSLSLLIPFDVNLNGMKPSHNCFSLNGGLNIVVLIGCVIPQACFIGGYGKHPKLQY
ncbi:hypothetical protein BJX76DRAFT_338334 [Aspergillus varians]